VLERLHHDAATAQVGNVVMVFDVIVVGAGPGGSNAAAVALRHGLTVAQIDRHKFPRLKPCAGGITIKSGNALQFDLQSEIRGESRAIEFNVWHRRTNRFTRPATALLRMVSRPEFDNWLVSENLKARQFQFFDHERVLDITYDGVFQVRTSKQTLRGRQLVGADGAYSVVNKLFPVTRPKGFAVAAEVMLRRDEATLPVETPPCFDFGAIDSGYGWVFPKADHWNVGLYTLGKGKSLRERIATYIAEKGFRVASDPLATFAAHLFPYGGYRVTRPKAPVYIVGDAGGFGDAITGEGIYHALESGRIAGETINDCLSGKVGHAAYYQRLRRSVLLDTFVTYHVSQEFYRNVARSVTILENPFVWRPLVQGYADGVTFSRSVMKGLWFLSKAIALRPFRYRREGTSTPLSLWGPLRGLPYVCEPLVRWPQRYWGASR
jgi:geranylgeranyl reductase family protein